MAKELVTDQLWEVIEPPLPEEPPKPKKGGRPRIPTTAQSPHRHTTLFVLKSAIPWEVLAQEEMDCGCGMTCWRRIKE